MTVMTSTELSASEQNEWACLLDETERALLRPYGDLLEQLQAQAGLLAERAGLALDAAGLRRTIVAAVARPLCGLIARAQVLAYRRRRVADEASGVASPSFFDALRMPPMADASCLRKCYPLLGPRIDGLAEQFLVHMASLLARLGADFDWINTDLCGGRARRIVTGVELLGDPHLKGACVSGVELASRDGAALRVIYKPRALQVDVAFTALLDEIATHADIRFKTPRCIAASDYGWVEFIDHATCGDAAEVPAYYRRLGWLLAIVHALNGTDVHAGNVIACGAHPVIVDLECLLCPDLAGASASSRLVMFTAMVPTMRMAVADRPGFDASAFSGRGGVEHSYHDWVLVDDDGLSPRIERRPKVVEDKRNVPHVDGVDADPFEYERDFIAGFNDGYRWLLTHRAALLSERGALRRFKGVEVRVILRNTGEYLKAIYESSHPRLLSSRRATKTFYLAIARARPDASLQATEIDSLYHGVVPRFSMASDDREVRDMHGCATLLTVRRSGYEGMRAHVGQELSEQMLAEQMRLLRQCLGVMRINRGKRATVMFEAAGTVPLADAALRLSASILDALDRHDVGRRTPAWYSAEIGRGGSCVATRADWSLWKGSAGVMLAYLHALQRIKHVATRRALERGVAFLLSDADPSTLLLPSHCGYQGAGGIVLLLSTLGAEPGFEVGDDRLQAFLDVQKIAACGSRRQGIAGIAGDLLLLIEAERISGKPAITCCLDEMVAHVMDGAAFNGLSQKAARGRWVPRDFWSSELPLLLALLRYAARRGKSDLHLQCSNIAERVYGDDDDAYLDVLGMMALRLEMLERTPHWVTTLRGLANRLRKTVDRSCLGHQYGLGSYLGMLERLVDSGVVEHEALIACSHEYLARATKHVRDTMNSAVSCCFIADLSRGYAGMLLRILNLCDRKHLPSPFLF